MPRFDGTGPIGMGPMTGRGLGPCAGCPPCGYGFGMGWRRGFGKGRGLGRYFGFQNWPGQAWFMPPTKKDQLKSLAEYRKALEEELEDLRKEEQDLSKEE